MVWLPDGEKNWKIVFICFYRIHKRDGQTDKWITRDGITVTHSMAQQKSYKPCKTIWALQRCE